MRHEVHHWHSPRLGRELWIDVYGHYGYPIVGFPTSAGDNRELYGQGLIPSLADFIEAGRVKIYCIDAANNESFYNKRVHPFHRSWVQKQYDDYIRYEVAPFIHWHCKTPDIPITTMGASFGAYHAANTLLKHPDVVKRCFAMSGVYDIRRFMDGQHDENFYFNNPIDYIGNLSDPWYYQQYATCDIHLATGHGPWEDSGPTYRFSELLRLKGIPHHVDDWGPMGGHDWPYWKHQMRNYLAAMF